jgi:hypothetical protein
MTRGKKESSLALFLFRIIQFSAHRLQTRRSRVGRPRHLRVLHVNALRPRRRKHANVHALSANPQVAGREVATFACFARERAVRNTQMFTRSWQTRRSRVGRPRHLHVLHAGYLPPLRRKHANVHSLSASPQVTDWEPATYACYWGLSVGMVDGTTSARTGSRARRNAG